MTDTPLKLRIGASLSGGLIGALNPGMFVFNPTYIGYIQQHFQFSYAAYATMTLLFFLTLLFLPCTLSTFCLYPWLYKRLTAFIADGKIPRFDSYVKLGTGFGCMATFVTAFFFSLDAITFNFMHNQPMDVMSIVATLTAGTFFVGIFGLCFLPLIAITGTLFVWVNDMIIRKATGAPHPGISSRALSSI